MVTQCPSRLFGYGERGQHIIVIIISVILAYCYYLAWHFGEAFQNLVIGFWMVVGPNCLGHVEK